MLEVSVLGTCRIETGQGSRHSYVRYAITQVSTLPYTPDIGSGRVPDSFELLGPTQVSSPYGCAFRVGKLHYCLWKHHP